MWFVKVSNDLCGGENKHKAPYQWKKKHHLVWEKAHGNVPRDYKIVFLNNDTLDCRLENLYLASDAVHMMMIKYGWYFEEPELTKAALKSCELELLTRKKPSPMLPTSETAKGKNEIQQKEYIT